MRDAAGKYLLVLPKGGPPRVLIERPLRAVPDPRRSGGRRARRSATWTATARTRSWRRSRAPTGSPSARSSTRTGQVKRRLDLEPGTALLNRGPTGSLGPGRGRWILLRMFGEGPSQGRRPWSSRSTARPARSSGSRDHYASYGPNPVIFAAHLPTAVHRLRRRRRGRLARLLGELLRRHQRQGQSRPRGARGPLRRAPRPLDGLQLSLAGEGPGHGRARRAAQQLLRAGA